MTAYQIGFDLYENSTQVFLQRVTAALARSPKLDHLMKMLDKDNKQTEKKALVVDSASGSNTVIDANKEAKANGVDVKKDETKEETAPMTAVIEKPEPSTSTVPIVDSLSDSEKELKTRLENLISILSGDKVSLQFSFTIYRFCCLIHLTLVVLGLLLIHRLGDRTALTVSHQK